MVRGRLRIAGRSFRSTLLAALFLAQALLAAENPGDAASEIRMLDDAGRVLLSRDGKPLAVLQLRPAAKGDEAILSLEAAKEAILKNPKSALALKREAIREFPFPLPTGNEEDFVSVMWRARKIASGARILSDSVVHGPAIENLSPGEKLPRPEPLEVALEIFADSEGSLPKLTSVNGERADKLTESAFISEARAFDYEGKNGFRVAVSRSAPADWSIHALAHSILLRTRLRPDPHVIGSWGSFVLYLGSAADDAPPETSPLVLDRAQVPARDFVEGYARVYASGANPFSLSKLTLVAEVALPALPSGDVPVKRLPCYLWQSPESDKAAAAESEFRFRYAPPAIGTYGIRIVAISATGEVQGDAVPLHVVAPASRGFARTRNGSVRLRLDDGSTIFPLGYDLKDARDDKGEKEAPAEKFRKRLSGMVREGANCVRVSLAREGTTLEKKSGVFDPITAEAIDEMLRAAEARGIFVILSFENGVDLKTHTELHPYFRELGGPLIASPEFFRDVAAKRLFGDRITYAAARFGAFRSLLSWELINRVDESWPALMKNPDDGKLAPGDADLCRRARRDVQNWVEEMALLIKGMDQHEHPVAVSTTVSMERPWVDLEKVEHLDWVLTEDAELKALAGNENEVTRLCAWSAASREPNRAHRPAMFGSLSAAANSDALIRHNALFTSLATNFAGAPLLPAEFAGRSAGGAGEFSVAAVFASALSEILRGDIRDTSRETVNTVESPDGARLRVLAVFGRRGIAAWIQDERPAKGGEDADIKETDIRLPGLPEGRYDAVWMDAWSGKVLRSTVYDAPAKKIDRPIEPFSIASPVFKRDVLLMIVRAKAVR